jgi:hypothetical protein
MKTMSNPLAGLLLAVLACVLLFAGTRAGMPFGLTVALGLATAGLLFGTVGTLTYRAPAVVAGGTTAPTAAQVTNMVCVDVAFLDGDTATTVTHNLSGVSTTGADGSPMVHSETLVKGATPVGSGFTVAFTTNAIILTPVASAAGNGQTYRFWIWRHSILSNFTK